MKNGITRYIDPLLDFSFKKIFGSEPNKDLLMSLLNEIFRGRKNIIDLIYGQNEHPGDSKEEGYLCLHFCKSHDDDNNMLFHM